MKTEQRSLPIIGMHCMACAVKIEEKLKKTEGVEQCSVLFNEKSLQVKFNPQKTDIETIAQSIQEVGFELLTADTEIERNEKQIKALHREQKRLTFDTIGAWIATILMMCLMWFPFSPTIHHWGMPLLAGIVLLVFSYRFHKAAIKQALHFVFSMDTLVSLSTTISFLAGMAMLFWPNKTLSSSVHIYFDATVMVPAFVLLGKWIEERATRQTGNAISTLLNSRPKWALVFRDGVVQELPITHIQVGDKIRVRAGDAVPVDGEILKGQSSIDEQLINGEPLPKEKSVGSKVFAGTINGQGAITIKAESVGSKTVLGTIIEAVRRAETEKAPIRRIADRIAGIFVPVVLLLSLFTWILWQWFGANLGISVSEMAIRSAISVLVISCPCALGLATPTALTVLIGETAKRKMLIHKAGAMETLAKVGQVFLDKTGTITEGKAKVIREEWFVPEEEKRSLRSLLYEIEQQSTHPLGKAITNYLEEMEREECLVENVQTIIGQGITAQFQGKLVRVGKASFVGMMKDSEGNHSNVYLSIDEKVVGHWEIADTIAPKSKEAILELQAMGLEITLLTGDNETIAKSVAQELNIESFHANLLPAEKGDFLRQAQKEGRVVAMIGDGINDSEALSLADISIALASGSDVAVAVADLVLLKNDLSLVPLAIQMIKQTQKTIYTNFFWALCYNLLAIPIAGGLLYPSLGILITPAIAGAAMAFSSISVVLNSLWLKRKLSRI